MGVALITPFKEDGSVDYDALVRLVEYQVQNGVDFLCVLGTTAETPTLTAEEKQKIKKTVIERVNGRVPILLGIGSNCTQGVIDTLKNDDFIGSSPILQQAFAGGYLPALQSDRHINQSSVGPL